MNKISGFISTIFPELREKVKSKKIYTNKNKNIKYYYDDKGQIKRRKLKND